MRCPLPPGAWTIAISGDMDRVTVRVEVPESGTVTVEAPPLSRGKP